MPIDFFDFFSKRFTRLEQLEFSPPAVQLTEVRIIFPLESLILRFFRMNGVYFVALSGPSNKFISFMSKISSCEHASITRAEVRVIYARIEFSTVPRTY